MTFSPSTDTKNKKPYCRQEMETGDEKTKKNTRDGKHKDTLYETKSSINDTSQHTTHETKTLERSTHSSRKQPCRLVYLIHISFATRRERIHVKKTSHIARHNWVVG